MTRASIFLTLFVPLAALAAEPEAELSPSASPAEITVGGAAQHVSRVGAGKSLGLKLSGPATIKFELRVEGASPSRELGAEVQIDGKQVSRTAVQPQPDVDARSAKGPITRPVAIEVKVASGKHEVELRWPAEASSDALVGISGVKLAPARSAALPLPGDLPLPVPAAKKDTKVAALPLPGDDAFKSADAARPPKPGVGTTPATTTSAPASSGSGAALASTTAKPGPSASGSASTTRTLTANRADDKAGSAQQPGFANASSGQIDLRLRQRGSEANLWSVTARVGAERSTESYTDPVSHSHFGLEGTRDFSTAFLALASFDWRSSTQGYVISLPNSSGSRGQMLSENRFDLRGAVGYDFGPRLLQSGRLELMPLLGVHYMGIRNDAFPSDLIGAEVGGRARFSLSSSVILQTLFGYTYNFSFSQTHSALGAPQGDFALRAGLALPLAGNYALELDYQGDILAFQYVYRVAHGAALGFSSSF